MIPRFLNNWLPADEKSRAQIFTGIAFVLGLLCSPVASFVMNGTMSSLQERGTFPMIQQQIEWTRSVAATIPCDGRVLAFAPIIASVVEMDRRIAHEHEAQMHLYSRFFSRRAWLQVELIPVPCETIP